MRRKSQFACVTQCHSAATSDVEQVCKDGGWVQALADGPGGEFSRFFEQNYSLAVAVAQRRLDSIEAAEDVASAAFEIVWDQFRDGRELKVPWFYGVLRNLVGAEYRRRDRAAALQQKLVGEARESQPAESEFAHLYEDVREAIACLTTDQADIILMTYWDDLSAREVAEVLGISHVAVRTRLSRARRALRHELIDRNIVHEGASIYG